MAGDRPERPTLRGESNPRPRRRDYALAALTGVPGAQLLPPLRRSSDALPTDVVELRDVRVDRDHLARYARLCGFRVGDHLPATYPHVLSFGAQLRLMTRRDFPFPAIGLVHVANSITVRRPLPASSPLTIRVQARDLRPHPRGRQLSLVSTAWTDGELVWEDTSTYLRRGSGADPQADRPGPPPVDLPPGPRPLGLTERRPHRPLGLTERRPHRPLVWHLPGDLGRRYAAVSGDRNPIHLNSVLARGFGFPRAIAHGMWTAARALSAVQQRLPERYRYDVAFGSPILLPSTVTLSLQAGDAPGRAQLAVLGDSGRIHLTGLVEEL